LKIKTTTEDTEPRRKENLIFSLSLSVSVVNFLNLIGKIGEVGASEIIMGAPKADFVDHPLPWIVST
jgi:hypothetical protein